MFANESQFADGVLVPMTTPVVGYFQFKLAHSRDSVRKEVDAPYVSQMDDRKKCHDRSAGYRVSDQPVFQIQPKRARK